MLSSSVCNHTGDKQIELSLCGRPIYRPNWIPLSPITITYQAQVSSERLQEIVIVFKTHLVEN